MYFKFSGEGRDQIILPEAPHSKIPSPLIKLAFSWQPKEQRCGTFCPTHGRGARDADRRPGPGDASEVARRGGRSLEPWSGKLGGSLMGLPWKKNAEYGVKQYDETTTWRPGAPSTQQLSVTVCHRSPLPDQEGIAKDTYAYHKVQPKGQTIGDFWEENEQIPLL